MRLITGPPASGKTELVLERFRARVAARDQSVRLLVPTATMAQHLQNRLAREGLVFRTGLVQTLSRFIAAQVEDIPQASDAVLYKLVEKAVARANRPELARVADLPGLWASIAQTILEFSSAGCDSERLARSLPSAPLGEAFVAVYREVDRELERRGLALRARRLQTAAARIRERGAGGVDTIWLDGFHALPEPELDVIEALAGKADVTLALSDANVTDRIKKLCRGREQTSYPRPHSVVAVVPAPSIEREVEEIARRIIVQAGSRPFREIGIIVRQPERYVPILRTTLERFGIPARFYFDSGLSQHPVIRLLTGAVDAMLGGWDHEQVLAALRLAPRWADSHAVDRFDFDVRKQIPNQGLGALKSLLLGKDGALLPGADKLMHKLDAIAGFEELRSLVLSPADWAARLLTLRSLFRPAPPAEKANHETALLWRSQAEALKLFEEALREAALVQEPDRIVGLEEFWPDVKSVLRLKVMRLSDARRNVVQVLTAHEARQWLLPVVFVCGLVEKQFPQFHPQSAFFDETARAALNAAGIALRTAADFEREEEALFDSALARSTVLATLSYPEFDARGDANLPSLFLGSVIAPVEPARTVRPRPRSVAGIRPPAPISLPGAPRRAARAQCQTPSHGPRNLSTVPVPIFCAAHAEAEGAAPPSRGPAGFHDAGQHRARGVEGVVAGSAAHRSDLRVRVRPRHRGKVHSGVLPHRTSSQRYAPRPAGLRRREPVAARALPIPRGRAVRIASRGWRRDCRPDRPPRHSRRPSLGRGL